MYDILCCGNMTYFAVKIPIKNLKTFQIASRCELVDRLCSEVSIFFYLKMVCEPDLGFHDLTYKARVLLSDEYSAQLNNQSLNCSSHT